jgi:hypothetical protein
MVNLSVICGLMDGYQKTDDFIQTAQQYFRFSGRLITAVANELKPISALVCFLQSNGNFAVKIFSASRLLCFLQLSTNARARPNQLLAENVLLLLYEGSTKRNDVQCKRIRLFPNNILLFHNANLPLTIYHLQLFLDKHHHRLPFCKTAHDLYVVLPFKPRLHAAFHYDAIL